MRYFIDFIPTQSFLNALESDFISNKSSIVFNVYLKELPSMNVNSFLYCDEYNFSSIFKNIKNMGFEINLMLDAFCSGNKEFNVEGGKNLHLLDRLLKMNPDYITITNHFYSNYIRQKYPCTKQIFSEYSEIGNIQKIYRYLEELNGFAVKINTEMAKDRNKMEYIGENFSKDSIHIDLNKGMFSDNIYSDSLHNNIAHYIQKEEWDKAKELLKSFREEQISKGFELLVLDKSDVTFLQKVGFSNFWCYCGFVDEGEYVSELKSILAQDYDNISIYPWSLL